MSTLTKQKVRAFASGIARRPARIDWSDFDPEFECSVFSKLRKAKYHIQIEIQFGDNGIFVIGELYPNCKDALPIKTLPPVKVPWRKFQEDPEATGHDVSMQIRGEIEEYAENIMELATALD